MTNKPPHQILIAELSYVVTVVLAVGAGYVFWKGNIVPKVPKDSVYGVYSTIPLYVLITLAMVAVFLFTLRRILVKTGVLTREESFRFLWSRTWYQDK
jgi:uncharacterized membrane protein